MNDFFNFDLKTYISFGSLTVSITAIIVACLLTYLANWRRNRKSLSFNTSFQSPIFLANKSVRKDLEVFYKSKKVQDVYLTAVVISNDGQQPIDEKDFKTDITFNIPTEVEVLEVSSADSKPENLNPQIKFTQNEVSISPLLLNPRDKIAITILTSGVKYDLKPSARIVGVKEIMQTRKRKNGRLFTILPYVTVLLCLLYLVFLVIFFSVMTNYEVIKVSINIFFLLFLGISSQSFLTTEDNSTY